MLSGATYHKIQEPAYHLFLPTGLTFLPYSLALQTGLITWSYQPCLTTCSYHLVLPPGLTIWSYHLVLSPGPTVNIFWVNCEKIKNMFWRLMFTVILKNIFFSFLTKFSMNYFGFIFDHLTIASFRKLLELDMNCCIHFVLSKALKNVHSSRIKLGD